MPNIWTRIACVRDDRPADLQDACDLFSQWTGLRLCGTDVRRLANLLSLGYTAHAAAMREWGYRLSLAVSASYMPSHCVWSGHGLEG